MGTYLSIPSKSKTSENGEREYFRYGFSCMQGWRAHMEDAHIILPHFTQDYSLFAIFDGHGGKEVATFCSIYFPKELQQNAHFLQGNFKKALEETFLKMDEILSSSQGQQILKDLGDDKSNYRNIGCTANVVLISKKDLYVANCGDSRSVLQFKDQSVEQLSEDHKPDSPKEKKRIVKAGGFVSDGRVNRSLNLSRALGDFEFKKNKALPPHKQIISAFPDVFHKEMTGEESMLIIGCDGVYELKNNEEIFAHINMRLRQNPIVQLSVVVEDLLDELIAMDSCYVKGCDNMSCILIKFEP